MGLALIAALCLLQGSAQLGLEAIKREHAEIRALLEEPETFEEGRRALSDFTLRLAAAPDVPPVVVVYRARELAEDAVLTPEPSERLAFCECAIRHAREGGYGETELALEGLRAELLQELGREGEACEALSAALGAQEAWSLQRAHLEVTLADLLRRRGEFKRAGERLAAIAARAETGEGWQRARVKARTIRANLLLDLGYSELALPLFTELVEEWRRLFDADQAEWAECAGARLDLLRARQAAGDHDGVLREARAWRAEADSGLDSTLGARLGALLGASLFEAERRELHAGRSPARGARGEWLTALRDERDATRRAQLHVWLAEEALARGEGDAAEEQLGRADLRGAPLSLRADFGVARVRAEQLGGEVRAESRQALEELWREVCASWESAERETRGLPFLKYAHRRGVLSTLIDLDLAQPGGVQRALERWLAAQDLSSLSSEARGRATLASLRHELLRDERHGLVIFLSAREGSHAFAVDRGRVSHHALPPSGVLEESRRAHVAVLATRGVLDLDEDRLARLTREEEECARELSRLLLPQGLLERSADWTRLSVSGLDTLGPLPVAWLFGRGSQRLGARLAVDEVPSLSAACALGALEPAPQEAVLLWAPQRSADSPASLPEVEASLPDELIARLETLYASHGLLELKGPDATEEALAAIDLDEVGVLELVAHGVDLPGRLPPRVLALTPTEDEDGWLGVEEIERLRGAPRLVVLAACSAGSGALRRGDAEVEGLVGAWLARGTRAVIAPDDELTLREARRVTRRLHEELVSAGASPAEALRRARLELLRESPRTAPFLAARLRVVGRGHEPLFRAREVRQGLSPRVVRVVAVIAGAVLLVAGLAGIARRRRVGLTP